MSSSQPPPEPPDGTDRPPSWMGAPGYSPLPELPPHAPMPGAPPYPPAEEHPPPPVGQRSGTGYPAVLGATAVPAVANLLLTVVLAGPAPSARAAGGLFGALLVAMVLASLPTWLIARRRALHFPLLVALALPFYLLFRLIAALS